MKNAISTHIFDIRCIVPFIFKNIKDDFCSTKFELSLTNLATSITTKIQVVNHFFNMNFVYHFD